MQLYTNDNIKSYRIGMPDISREKHVEDPNHTFKLPDIM